MIPTWMKLIGRCKPSGPQNSPVLRHAALSDVGRLRQNNEDRWFADTEMQLYLVSDGMGGQMAGEMAARIVTEVLPTRLRTQLEDSPDFAHPKEIDRVLETVRELSRNVRSETAGQPGLAGMGATLVLLLVRGPQALLVHLGDSRAYRWRQGKLECLTRDHTLVQLLIEDGVLAPAQAAAHPARHQLSRFVGMPSEPLPEFRLLDLASGDRLLLCTDGLTSMLANDQVCRILSQEACLEHACLTLIEAANAAGGQDNVTVVLVEVGGD
jgi:protein phosphatase